jgi:hypothetical protein
MAKVFLDVGGGLSLAEALAGMSMRERVQKLKAHTEQILDLFLELKENYAFLEPMLFDRDVVSTYGSAHKARGFNAIKFLVFLHVCPRSCQASIRQ